MRARALYNYQGRSDNELSFQKEDIITIIDKKDKWWYGMLDGITGYFPYNYVEELPNEKPKQSNIKVFRNLSIAYDQVDEGKVSPFIRRLQSKCGFREEDGTEGTLPVKEDGSETNVTKAESPRKKSKAEEASTPRTASSNHSPRLSPRSPRRATSPASSPTSSPRNSQEDSSKKPKKTNKRDIVSDATLDTPIKKEVKLKIESPRSPRSPRISASSLRNSTDNVVSSNAPPPPKAPEIQSLKTTTTSVPKPAPFAPFSPAAISSPRIEKTSSPAPVEKLSHLTMKRPAPVGRRPPTIRSHTVASISQAESSESSNEQKVSDQLRNELEALKAELQRKDRELGSIASLNQSQLSAKDAEINKLRVELEEEKKRSTQSISELKRQLAQEQEQRFALEKAKEEIEKKVKVQPIVTESSASPRRKELARLQEQLKEEIELRKQHEQWKLNLEAELRNLRSRVDEENRVWEKDLEHVKREKRLLEDELQTTKTKLSNETETVNSLKQDIVQLQSRTLQKNENAELIEELKKSLVVEQTARTDLQNDLEQLRFSSRIIKENLENEVQTLRNQLEQSNAKLRTETTAKANLQVSVAKLENDLREFKHRMLELVGMLDRKR